MILEMKYDRYMEISAVAMFDESMAWRNEDQNERANVDILYLILSWIGTKELLYIVRDVSFIKLFARCSRIGRAEWQAIQPSLPPILDQIAGRPFFWLVP